MMIIYFIIIGSSSSVLTSLLKENVVQKQSVMQHYSPDGKCYYCNHHSRRL